MIRYDGGHREGGYIRTFLFIERNNLYFILSCLREAQCFAGVDVLQVLMV